MLFADSDNEIEVDLKTNNEYANNYNNWRQKEELNKLKTKYGEEVLEFDYNDTSSSSEEDEDGIQFTEDIERDFFKTLSNLKNKDPKIYDENVEFFKDSPVKLDKKKNKEQPMYLKDYERKLILEKGGHISDSEDEINKSLTYVEEQNKLKKSLKDALQDVPDSDGEEWGGMFKTREKSDEQKKNEEEEYKEWLLGHKNEINDKQTECDLKPLKDYWSDPNLEDGEKFLRDYILNKRFLENENDDHIPTYEEIVHDSDEGLSEDEQAIEKQEEFEHKYNYRFEEPDQEFIKRFPRVMENSLRKKDDRRKLKRAEVKDRKQKEKQQKMEEIKSMHALKKKEIEEKIIKLKEITGNTEVPFQDEDIDGDFDPDAHDKRMQKLFDDEFYQGAEEEQKPEFPEIDEELELENWDKYEETNENDETNELHCEDENFNMDCDYDPTAVKEQTENSKGRKKRKRKSNFAKVLSEPKPVFDPNNKTYEKYLDEYYKLDCEDIIGDIPCRFKYRKVIPNNFGLSVEEILLAKDRELNRWCSLKKAIQYRPDNIEKYDVIAFDKKSKNEGLKKKILPSLFAEEKDQVLDHTNQMKEEIAPRETSVEENSAVSNNMSGVQVKEDSKKKKKKNKNKSAAISGDSMEQSKESTNHLDSGINAKEITITKTAKSNLQLNTVGEPSCVNENMAENMNVSTKKKRSKKNNKTFIKNVADETTLKRRALEKDESGQYPKKVKKDKGDKKLSKVTDSNPMGISDARLTAYGFKPKKFKNKLKYNQNKK